MPCTEFEELSQSIQDLKAEFQELKRPEGLPAPGERLMPMQDTTVIPQQRNLSYPKGDPPTNQQSESEEEKAQPSLTEEDNLKDEDKPADPVAQQQQVWYTDRRQSSPSCSYS